MRTRFRGPLSGALALFVIVFCVYSPTAARAQATGAIAGTVRDSVTFTPLSAVLVEAVNERGETVADDASGPRGTYRLGGLAGGTYAVRFTLPGWERATLPGQSVRPGETTLLNQALAERSFSLNPITVTVSRANEKLLDAPGAVEVVQALDIRERPAITTADHLKEKAAVDFITTGLQGHYVVMRGFNNVFSGAALTLTDNRIARLPSLRANIPSFNPATGLDLDRTEIVLGPGSALYGPNADRGAIHSITRSPIDDPGVGVSAAGGVRQQDAFAEQVDLDGDGAADTSVVQAATRKEVWHVEGRTAAKLSDGRLGLKLSGQYFTGLDYLFIDQEEVKQQVQAEECIDGGFEPTAPACLNFAEGLDLTEPAEREILVERVENVATGRDSDLERWSLDARLDWRPNQETSVVLSAGRATATKSIELTGLGAGQVIDWAYDYLQGRVHWRDLFAQVFINRSDNDDTYLLRTGRRLIDHSELIVGQIQHAWHPGSRHRLIYGVDVLRTIPKTQGTINGQHETNDNITEVGGYLQWEAELDRRLELVLASRIDHNSRLEDPVYSPRAAVVYRPHPAHSLRLSFNRAFSTPNTISFFLDIAGGTETVFGPFRYDVRAQGGGDTGFTFAREDGLPMHQSPFNQLLGGSPREFLPTTTPMLWTEAVAAAEVLAASGAVEPEAAALLRLLGTLPVPDESQVGLAVLSARPDAGEGEPGFAPVPGGLDGIDDLPPLGASTSNTWEVGYKGLVGERLLVAGNAWYTHISDQISALRVISPNVFLEEASLATYLTEQFTGLFPDEDTARAAADELAGTLSRVPLGIVTPEQAGGAGSTLVLTDRNLPAFGLFGADVAVSAWLDERWSAEATAAWVSDDQFTAGEGPDAEVVSLNAPILKGSATLRYRNEALGLNGAVRFRATKSFPASSGVYAGDVDGYEVVDLNLGYRFPGASGLWVQLDVQNLFDAEYRTFVGAPTLGRLGLVRVRCDLPRR